MSVIEFFTAYWDWYLLISLVFIAAIIIGYWPRFTFGGLLRCVVVSVLWPVAVVIILIDK